jgi:beta-lactam-binding protein with PASTA domain
VYDEESYQYPAPPKSPVPVAVLTSVITTILMFFGLRLLEDRGLFGQPQAAAAMVEVPSVIGLRLDQAREQLRGRDLVVAMGGERDDPRVVPGAVSAQNPVPGAQSPRGGAVQLILARATGPTVPNLVGMRGEDAVRQLATAGLQVGPQKTAASPTVPPGAVVQTEPPAGTPAPPGSIVTVVLSTGPTATTTVPKVLGMRMSRGRKLIEDAGFRVGRVRIGSNDDRMGGVILKQEPPEGTPAQPGTPIDLVVNED